MLLETECSHRKNSYKINSLFCVRETVKWLAAIALFRPRKRGHPEKRERRDCHDEDPSILVSFSPLTPLSRTRKEGRRRNVEKKQIWQTASCSRGNRRGCSGFLPCPPPSPLPLSFLKSGPPPLQLRFPFVVHNIQVGLGLSWWIRGYQISNAFSTVSGPRAMEVAAREEAAVENMHARGKLMPFLQAQLAHSPAA